MRLRKHQSGLLLFAAIFMLVVIIALLVGLGYLNSAGLGASAAHGESEKAYLAAYSGTERASLALTDPVLANRLDCLPGAAPAVESLSNVSAGTSGAFSVSVAGGAANYATSPATLSSSILAGDMRIPVSTVTGYTATGGRIMVDRELIDYAATSTSIATCSPFAQPCFVVSRRGVAGTVASAHANATRVGQFHCIIQSSGGVPDLGAGTVTEARRTLNQAVQLFEGWTGGVAGAANQQPWLARYQDATSSPWSELTDGSFAIGAGGNINSISMLSYADGFAVGNSVASGEVIYRWQSNPAPGWVRVGPTAAIPDVNLNGIYCLTGNYCWVVGEASGGLLAANWNGVAWTRDASATALAAVALSSVHCISTTDCWAVGANSGGLLAIRWNGAAWVRNATATGLGAVALQSVHCTSSSDCWAVGASSGGLLAIHWDGAAWTRNATATGLAAVALNSVYCNSSTDCWAMGANSGGLLVIRWNGIAWTRDASATALANVPLNAVTCVHAKECWAVGDSSAGELIIKWNGAAWIRHGVSAAVSDRNLNTIQMLGAARDPGTARKELVP